MIEMSLSFRYFRWVFLCFASLAILGCGGNKTGGPALNECDPYLGCRTRQNIAENVGKKSPALTYIYNAIPERRKHDKDRVVVKFKVTGEGKVTEAHATECTLDHDELCTKFVDEIQKWEFDSISKLDDTTVVIIPFVFLK